MGSREYSSLSLNFVVYTEFELETKTESCLTGNKNQL